ncbi:MAG: pyridoxamine 5'-phosphate oxidase family protein [Flavobacteriaceae bacterium]
MKRIVIALSLVCIFACNHKQTANKDLFTVAKEIIKNSKNCALITVDSLGIADARTMDPFLPEEDFTIWMATNPKSKKVSDIKNNPKATLYYFDKAHPGYVTIQGVATLVNLPEQKKKFWKEAWKNFYKDKTTGYLLIKFTPHKMKVISEKYKVLGDSITWKSPEIEF